MYLPIPVEVHFIALALCTLHTSCLGKTSLRQQPLQGATPANPPVCHSSRPICVKLARKGRHSLIGLYETDEKSAAHTGRPSLVHFMMLSELSRLWVAQRLLPIYQRCLWNQFEVSKTFRSQWSGH